MTFQKFHFNKVNIIFILCDQEVIFSLIMFLEV